MDKKKPKQVRSSVEPSPVININIKKWKHWKTKTQQRKSVNDLQIMENKNEITGKQKLSQSSKMRNGFHEDLRLDKIFCISLAIGKMHLI